MAGPENTNQKIEATTENVDVSQKNQDFMKDRDLLKKDESEAISEDASALAEIEKQLDSGGAKNEKQAEILKDMKDWLKKYKAEGVMSDAELKGLINTSAIYKTFELLRKKVLYNKLINAARDRGIETDTQPYVVVDGKKYDTKGLKWSHREKSFVKDKINIVPNDAPNVEFGGSEKKEKSQKSPDQETSFEKIVFTDSGKLKLEKFFSKFGAESQEAYNYNINILSKNIDAYIDRQISPDDFKKQLEQYNKIFGAEIFDVKAILELQKPKTISSGKGADPDAW